MATKIKQEGTCRWVKPLPCLAPDARGELMIANRYGEKTYTVEVGLGWYNLTCGDTTYTIRCHNKGAWECNCPDATQREERRYSCKHVKALREAIKHLPF